MYVDYKFVRMHHVAVVAVLSPLVQGSHPVFAVSLATHSLIQLIPWDKLLIPFIFEYNISFRKLIAGICTGLLRWSHGDERAWSRSAAEEVGLLHARLPRIVARLGRNGPVRGQRVLSLERTAIAFKFLMFNLTPGNRSGLRMLAISWEMCFQAADEPFMRCCSLATACCFP